MTVFLVRHLMLGAACLAVPFGCAKGIDPLGPVVDGGSGVPPELDAASAGGASHSGGASGAGTSGVSSGGRVAASTGGSSTAGDASSGGSFSGGAAGSSGAGGRTEGDGGTNDSPDAESPPPTPTGDLAVQYRTTDDTANNVMRPQLSIINRGTDAVPLEVITARYWYTVDGTPTGSDYQELNVDYADITRITNGSTNVTLTFSAVEPAQTGADHYLEVGFSGPDTLGAGQSTNQIEIRINWTGYTNNYDETNDFSWDGTKTTFSDWHKVTLYVDGVLVWGLEPDGTAPAKDDGGSGLADATVPAFRYYP